MTASRKRPTEVTDHAVERYIQRWRPDIQQEIDALKAAARRTLEAIAADSTFTGETDSEARAIWRYDLIGGGSRSDESERSSHGTIGPMLLCEQDGRFSTVLPRGSKAPNRRPQK